jgi:hypothetical protein
MKKRRGNDKLRKTLGLLSAGSIAASMFMGYNRLTGNVISAVENSSIVSIGGVALFVLGLAGVLVIARDK